MKKSRKWNSSDAIGALVAAIVTFASWTALALDFDANIEGYVRSFPLSGYSDVQFGLDQILWGSNSDSVMYGYIRPFVEADTAGTYNSGMVAMDFFPISFLGVRVGKEWIQNDTKYTDYRCDLYICTGTRERGFVQGNLLLGFGDWFTSAIIRWEDWTQKHPEFGDAIDANSGLAAHAYGDEQVVMRGITGLQLTDEWAAIAGLQYVQMTTHFGISRFWFLGPRWREGSLTISAGADYFESTESNGGWGAYLGFIWDPYPSLALH